MTSRIELDGPTFRPSARRRRRKWVVALARVRDLGRDEGATRVLLGHDGGWAGLLQVADLTSGGPVHGVAVG